MSNSVYSFIVCPACGRSFKFLDNLDHSSPTGQLLTCPKCRTMFAFSVSAPVSPASAVSGNIELPSGTAAVDDSEAFTRFIESVNESASNLTAFSDKEGSDS